MTKKQRKLSGNDEYWIEYGIDVDNRRVMLNEEVDEYSMSWIIRGILMMSDFDSDTPIKVYINTYGGSCYDGLALYDTIKNCKAPVHTYAIGKVMSMGTWIMLAGDEKYAYPNTTFMWHSISSSMPHCKMFDLETDTKECKRLYNQLLDIYGRDSNKSFAWWSKWIKYEDRYAGVDKAKELGFVDIIL